MTSISTAEVQTGKNSEQGENDIRLGKEYVQKAVKRQGGVHIFLSVQKVFSLQLDREFY